MSDQHLTVERLRNLLHYDPLTGNFTRRISVGKGGRFKAGELAGSWCSSYLVVSVDGKRYEGARLAMFYMNGAWPISDADHIDTDPSNNRWLNLRDIPHRANIENRRRPNKQNKVGLLGVCRDKQRPGMFKAQIVTGGKGRCLGHFSTPELAHAAYVTAKRELHEGNTI